MLLTLPVHGPYFDNLGLREDRKSTRLNSSHLVISYAVFCLKKKNLNPPVSYPAPPPPHPPPPSPPPPPPRPHPPPSAPLHPIPDQPCLHYSRPLHLCAPPPA